MGIGTEQGATRLSRLALVGHGRPLFVQETSRGRAGASAVTDQNIRKKAVRSFDINRLQGCLLNNYGF
jgi:hypothetical protein